MSITIRTSTGAVRHLTFTHAEQHPVSRDLHLYRPPFAEGWLVAGTGHRNPEVVKVSAEVPAGADLAWPNVGPEVNAVLADAADAATVQTPLGTWAVAGLQEAIPQPVQRGWRIDFTWLAQEQYGYLVTDDGQRIVTDDGAAILMSEPTPHMILVDDFRTQEGALNGRTPTTGGAATWVADPQYVVDRGIVRAVTTGYDWFATVDTGEPGVMDVRARLLRGGRWVGLLIGGDVSTGTDRPPNSLWVEADDAAFYLYRSVDGARQPVLIERPRTTQPDLATPQEWHVEARLNAIRFSIDGSVIFTWIDEGGVFYPGSVVGFQAGEPGTYEWANLRVAW